MFYGCAWSTLGLVIAWMYRHAWRKRAEIGLDRHECVGTAMQAARWVWVALVGGLSIAVALTVKPATFWMTGLPGMVYAANGLTPFLMRWAGRRAGRSIDREQVGAT